MGNDDLLTALTGTPPLTTTTIFVPFVSPPDVAPTTPLSPNTTTAAPAQKNLSNHRHHHCCHHHPQYHPGSGISVIQTFALDLSNAPTIPRSTILNFIHLSGNGNVLAMTLDRQIRVYRNNDSNNNNHITNSSNITIHHHNLMSVMPNTAIGEYCCRVTLNVLTFH